MNCTSRRVFMLRAAATGTAVLVPLQSRAANPILAESDPAAVALAYTADSSKVDNKKYPQHDTKVPQDCSGCQLYESTPGSTEPYGHCPLFEGKRVSVKGWCTSWA